MEAVVGQSPAYSSVASMVASIDASVGPYRLYSGSSPCNAVSFCRWERRSASPVHEIWRRSGRSDGPTKAGRARGRTGRSGRPSRGRASSPSPEHACAGNGGGGEREQRVWRGRGECGWRACAERVPSARSRRRARGGGSAATGVRRERRTACRSRGARRRARRRRCSRAGAAPTSRR